MFCALCHVCVGSAARLGSAEQVPLPLLRALILVLVVSSKPLRIAVKNRNIAHTGAEEDNKTDDIHLVPWSESEKRVIPLVAETRGGRAECALPRLYQPLCLGSGIPLMPRV